MAVASVGCAMEDVAGPLSRTLFLWVWPFLRDAHEQVQKASFTLASLPLAAFSEDPRPNIAKFEALIAEEALRSAPSAHRAFWRMWSRDFWRQAVVAFLISFLTSMSPLLLRQSIRAMHGHAPAEVGYLSILGMALIGICAGLLQQHNFHVWSRLGRLTWVAIVSIVFQKPARLDHVAFAQHFSEGQLLSLIGQDASIFPYMSPFAGIFMGAPLNVLFPSIVLSVFLREAFAVGLALCFLILFTSNQAAGVYKKLVAKKLCLADARLVLINESLQGIRSVKLCVWEAAIESRVEAIREEELSVLLRAHLCYALQQGLVAALPVLMAVATFVTHAALGRALEPEIVFMAMASLDQLAVGVLILPNAQVQMMTMSMAIARVARLAFQKDTYASPVTEGSTTGIYISDGTFQWSSVSGKPDLSAITLSVRPGDLVAVVGRVASGKSTLACAVLGLVPRVGGDLTVGGRCAFVPQSPQILNASVRDNIIFGEPYRENFYQEAIRCCALEPDIAQFCDGDLTEIGEKGINISGGQRARVAMARAFYSDADVVVMDDPLSAMDAYVGDTVFKGCVLGLQSAGKAVLLMTNQVHLCEAADHICVLEGGRVSQRGTFAELVGGGGVLDELNASAAPGEEDAQSSTEDTGCDPRTPQKPSNKSRLVASAPAADQAEQGSKPQAVLKQTATGQKTAGMTQEEVMQGRIGVQEFLRIAAVGRSLCLGAVLVLLCLAAPALMYTAGLLLGTWASAETGGNPMGRVTEFVLYISAGGLYTLCQGTRVSVAALFFTRLSRRLHERMLAAVIRQPMVWYDTTPLGRILNRFSQDVSLLDLQLPRLFEFSMQHFGVVLVGLIGSCALVWPSVFIVLPLLLVLRSIFQRYGAVSLHLQRIMLVSTSPVMSQASSFLTSLNTIRAFGKEAFFFREFVKAMTDFNQTYYWIHALDRSVQSVLVALCVPALTLSLGLGMLVFSRAGIFNPDLAALGIALVASLPTRIPLWLWCSATTEKFFGGAQRAGEYAELPWEGRPADHDAWIGWTSSEGLLRAAKEAPKDVMALQIEEVSVRYQPGLPLVLRGLSLQVEAGQRLGVCGRTGSGKSTLFLACFHMVGLESGRILIGGADAAAMPLPLLRASLAVVPQDTLMFSGTIRSNLDFYGCHSDDTLWQALRQVHLEEQVRELAGGLEAPVREKGSNFSVGTVQLLCIARVLLGRQHVVFLDECTASVDYQTDALVQTSVREVMAGRAVVCIAHRLHTIIDYDCIAYLEGGRLAEHGPPGKLLRSTGRFSRLVDSTGKTSAAKLRLRAAAAEEAVSVDKESSGTAAPTASRAEVDGARERGGIDVISCCPRWPVACFAH